MILNFLRDDRGATSIEYALVASLIGMLLVGAVSAIGETLNGTFEDVSAGFG